MTNVPFFFMRRIWLRLRERRGCRRSCCCCILRANVWSVLGEDAAAGVRLLSSTLLPPGAVIPTETDDDDDAGGGGPVRPHPASRPGLAA